MSTRKPSRTEEVVAQISQAIASGELQPGAILPSERELVQQYGISSGTVTRVIAALKAQGLVESEVGRGVFVRRPFPPMEHRHHRYLSYTDPLSDEALFRRRAHSRELKTFLDNAPWPTWAAPHLAATSPRLADQGALVRRTLDIIDSRPVRLVTLCLPREVAADLPDRDARDIDRCEIPYNALRDTGVHLTRLTEHAQARAATPEEAEQLDLPRAAPVLELIHRAYDQAGDLLALVQYVLRGDANVLTSELPLPE